jgi:hypothetical protein
VWQQSGQASAAAFTADPENRLWGRMPPRRLEAEAIRDNLLAVSGRLDPTLFGPPIEPFRAAEDREKRLAIGPLDGLGRRSIYQRMTLMEPPRFLALFNQPIPKLCVGDRDVTNVPDQALAMLNDPFVLAMAKHWSQRVLQDGASAPASRIQGMFQAAFGRPASPAEVAQTVVFVEQTAKLRSVPEAELLSSAAVWQDVAHLLFNAKEFLYLP